MSVPTSIPLSTEFKTLGIRQEWHYSNTEKEALFKKAVGQMKNFIQQYPDKPTSIPELVRQIFDDRIKAQELEDIRELLRPTNRFTRHEISASGHKLLALLAIQQDPHCLDANGKLRLEYTKSVMRGWFANGASIRFDDSALQNIQSDNSSGASASAYIRLGENRLSEIKLENKREIVSLLEKNYKDANFGEKGMTLKFAAVPQCTVKSNFNEIALGDMNGNSIMFLHQLIQSGLADIKQGKEQEWEKLMQSIKDGKVDGFREKLQTILECKKTDKKLVLLGDLLADRTYNDWFTLSIIDFLHEQGQNFSICFSNHDAAFVDYYLVNKNKSEDEKYGTDAKSGIKISVRPANSLEALNTTLNANPQNRDAFKRMSDNYLSHLVILDQSHDQRQIYAHGVLTENMLHDMLGKAELSDQQISDMSSEEKIQHANQYFREHILTNPDTFHDTLSDEEEDRISKPFRAAIWNIGPFPKNSIFANDQTHRYVATMPPNHLKVVHGHTADIRENMRTRESLYQKLISIKNDYTQERFKNIDQKLASDFAEKIIGLINLNFDTDTLSVCFCLLIWIYDNSNPKILNTQLEDLIKSLKGVITNYENNRGKWSQEEKQGQLNNMKISIRDVLFQMTGQAPANIRSDSHSFDESFHSMALQFSTHIRSFNRQKTSTSNPFNPLAFPIQSALNGIWTTKDDPIAAESYISLDAGVGSNESDIGGEARIYIS